MKNTEQFRPTRLLTKPEAARFLGISNHTLDRLVAQGIVAIVRLGGTRRFIMDDLLETIKQNRFGGDG